MRVDGEIPVRKIVREILNSSPRTGLATAEVVDNQTNEHTWLVIFGDGETLTEMGAIIHRGESNTKLASLLSDTTNRIIVVLYQDMRLREVTPLLSGYVTEEDAMTAAERMHELVEDELRRMRAELVAEMMLSTLAEGLEDLDDLDDEDDQEDDQFFWRRKTHD